MTRNQTLAGPRQQLGRRLGLEPYYVVAERTPVRLRLESRPDANRAAGIRVLATGAVLVLLAVVVAISGLTSAATGSGFAVAAIAVIVAAVLGGPGYQRLMGGYAVLTTSNRIVCDAQQAALMLSQRSKIGGERTQVLPFTQVESLRLRRRPLATGWPIQRVRPIVAIELVVGEHIWVIDTAADPEALRPVAEGLAEVMGREFAPA